jgi:hypothetical protein
LSNNEKKAKELKKYLVSSTDLERKKKKKMEE